jgi:GH15 family glucan-1,4-alpha-glucosidase
MARVAFDRAVKSIGRFGLAGPVDHCTRLRDAIHDEVCTRGFDTSLGAFVQSYDSKELDASLLMIPLVGFLPPDDPRMLGTVAAIEKRLVHDGFVARYESGSAVDGLPPGEGTFLPCTFWLADNYALAGRVDEARELFERLLGLANDVGLLAEQYDPRGKRMLGKFPQAFTHVGLVNTACNLHHAIGPAEHRLS